MGTHGSDSLSAFLLGNHCSRMINNSVKSLMVIPPEAIFKPIKKIALAIVIIPGKVYHHSAAKGTSDLRCKRAVKAPSSLSSMIFSKLSNFSCSA